jgi:hypothetical protein
LARLLSNTLKKTVAKALSNLSILSVEKSS